jgi:hypothetical protein
LLLNCISSCNSLRKIRYVIYMWKPLNLKLPDKFLLCWGYKNIFYCLQIYNLTLFSSWMCFRIKTSNFYKGRKCRIFRQSLFKFSEIHFALTVVNFVDQRVEGHCLDSDWHCFVSDSWLIFSVKIIRYFN